MLCFMRYPTNAVIAHSVLEYEEAGRDDERLFATYRHVASHLISASASAELIAEAGVDLIIFKRLERTSALRYSKALREITVRRGFVDDALFLRKAFVNALR